MAGLYPSLHVCQCMQRTAPLRSSPQGDLNPKKAAEWNCQVLPLNVSTSHVN